MRNKNECKTCGAKEVHILFEDSHGNSVVLKNSDDNAEKDDSIYTLRVSSEYYGTSVSFDMYQEQLAGMAHEILTIFAHKKIIEENKGRI